MTNSTSATADPQLLLEKADLAGSGVLPGIVYGFHIIVFIQCVYHLVKDIRRRRRTRRQSTFLLVFVLLMFTMGTLFLSACAKLITQKYIENRDYPGGPMAWYEAESAHLPYLVMGNVGWITGVCFSDGLLLWRTYVVWNSLLIIIFPTLVWLGSTAMSVMVIYETTRPNSDIASSKTAGFLISSVSMSLGLNIILTLLIVFRLLFLRRTLLKASLIDHGKVYTSIAAMIVESATLYTVVGIVYLAASVGGYVAVQDAIQGILMQVLLIILRVAKGHAWTSTTLQAETVDQKDGRYPRIVGRSHRAAEPGTVNFSADPGSQNDIALSEVWSDGATKSMTTVSVTKVDHTLPKDMFGSEEV